MRIRRAPRTPNPGSSFVSSRIGGAGLVSAGGAVGVGVGVEDGGNMVYVTGNTEETWIVRVPETELNTEVVVLREREKLGVLCGGGDDWAETVARNARARRNVAARRRERRWPTMAVVVVGEGQPQ